MKLRLFIAMLFSAFAVSMKADVTGVTPETGSSYFLYNVGQQKYLSVSGTAVSLSETNGTQFTVTSGSTAGTYTITATEGKLSTTFLGDVVCSDEGYYDEWKFSVISSTDNTYALGVLEDEDAYSFSYVYYSSVLTSLGKTSTMPSFADGQWKFVSSASLVTEVTLSESSTSYTKPSNLAGSVTVTLNRSALTNGKKGTFCVPFDMNRTQINEAFGENASVYEFSYSSGTRLYYNSTDYIKAGHPYIVKPSITHTGDYVIENVDGSSFVDEPIDVVSNGYTFRGIFVQTSVTPVFYAFSGGVLKYYTMTKSINGFRAYFFANTAESKSYIGNLDFGDIATDIEDVEIENTNSDIYNINGQKVSAAKASNNLAPGLYIINGKKTVIK